MGQVRALDERLDASGFLRLMTTTPRVRHMGNTVPEDLRAAGALRPRPARRRRRLLDWAPVRRGLLALHNQIFRWYFRD
jgi:hypothetical protein